MHGWLADTESSEYPTIATVEDYDNAVNVIVTADAMTKGQLVIDESGVGGSTLHSTSNDEWSEEDKQKINDGENHFQDEVYQSRFDLFPQLLLFETSSTRLVLN